MNDNDPRRAFEQAVRDLQRAAWAWHRANLRADIARRATAISKAGMGAFQGAASIGYGPPVIVFKVGETEFARAAVQSLNAQPKTIVELPNDRTSFKRLLARLLRRKP